MSKDDDLRKCCDDIEEVERNVKRLKTSGGDQAKQDLSKFEVKFERFVRDAREASQKLGADMREGWEGFVTAWKEAENRMRTHFRLIEAKGMLASARRLAKDQYYVAAESELMAALRIVVDAQMNSLVPGKDPYLAELVKEIEQAVTDIRAKAQTAAAALEKVVASNERLLAEFDKVA